MHESNLSREERGFAEIRSENSTQKNTDPEFQPHMGATPEILRAAKNNLNPIDKEGDRSSSISGITSSSKFNGDFQLRKTQEPDTLDSVDVVCNRIESPVTNELEKRINDRLKEDPIFPKIKELIGKIDVS